jgi:hypothetical protein
VARVVPGAQVGELRLQLEQGRFELKVIRHSRPPRRPVRVSPPARSRTRARR